jgi:hypothetical protein
MHGEKDNGRKASRDRHIPSQSQIGQARRWSRLSVSPAPAEQRLSGAGGIPIQTQDVSAREIIERELARLAARAKAKEDSSASDLSTSSIAA